MKGRNGNNLTSSSSTKVLRIISTSQVNISQATKGNLYNDAIAKQAYSTSSYR